MELQFEISPSNDYSGLISFRMDWFDLLVVQGTLKCLLQHQSSNASVLKCLAFFMVQLSHPHMTTGKTIALTLRTFVYKVTSLLFNMLSRFVIAFLPRSPLSTLLVSQESSPAPQFKSISSSVLIFLYGPAVTSTQDYLKNHTRWFLLDGPLLAKQCLCFLICYLGWS